MSTIADDTAETLSQIDSKISSSLSDNSGSDGDPGGAGSSRRAPPPLLVDGEIIDGDLLANTGLTVEARAEAAKNALLNHDDTFLVPLSPDHDLVEQVKSPFSVPFHLLFFFALFVCCRVLLTHSLKHQSNVAQTQRLSYLQSAIDDFVASFSVEQKTPEIEALIQKDGPVKVAYEELVGMKGAVSYSDFWARFYFRCGDDAAIRDDIERHEMIVHNMQLAYDKDVVEGIGKLLGGVGSRLSVVGTQVAKKMGEVVEAVQTDYDSITAAERAAENSRRARVELEVELTAKQIEVEQLTERLTTLEVSQGGAEGEDAFKKAVDEAISKREVKSARELAELKALLEESRAEITRMREEVEAAKKGQRKALEEAEAAKQGKERKASEEKASQSPALGGDASARLEEKDKEIAELKVEIETWKARAQKCRDDRSKVVKDKKDSDAAFKMKIKNYEGEITDLKAAIADMDRKVKELDRGDAVSSKSGESAVMIQSSESLTNVREGVNEGWGGWGDDD